MEGPGDPLRRGAEEDACARVIQEPPNTEVEKTIEKEQKPMISEAPV